MVKLEVVIWVVKKQSKKIKTNIIKILVIHMAAVMVILTPTRSAQRVTIKKLTTVVKIIKFENTSQYYRVQEIRNQPVPQKKPPW